MSETVTIRGTSYTIPEGGKQGWGAAVSAFMAAVPAQSFSHIQFGSAAVTGPGPSYLHPVYSEGTADGTELFFPVPVAGNLQGLRVRMTVAAEDGAPGPTPCVAFQVRINGVTPGIVPAEGLNGVKDCDAVFSIAVVAGDLISIEYTETTTITTPPEGIYATILLSME